MTQYNYVSILQKRAPLLPAIPSLAEAGSAGFTFSNSTGLIAPRGTPKPIIERLNTEVTFASGGTTLRAKMPSPGRIPLPTSPAELATLTLRATKKMMEMIQSNHISIERKRFISI